MSKQDSSNGFTLIEILLVLALLGLIATMLPQGLTKLFEKSSHQSLVQGAVSSARSCSSAAQQQQRSIRLGSSLCPMPNEVDSGSELLPVFNADGTASHSARLVIQSDATGNVSIITIDRLTASVSVTNEAPIN